jgi:hypothetical protein
MLDRQYGNVVFECDSCNEVLKTETRDFDDARDHAAQGVEGAEDRRRVATRVPELRDRSIKP